MSRNSVTVKSCRICLSTKYSNSVSFDDGRRKLMKMYKFCFGLNLSKKDEPRLVCGSCFTKTKEFFKFKLQTHKSDQLWKTIVNIKPKEYAKPNTSSANHVKKIKEESEDVYYVNSSDSDTKEQNGLIDEGDYEEKYNLPSDLSEESNFFNESCDKIDITEHKVDETIVKKEKETEDTLEDDEYESDSILDVQLKEKDEDFHVSNDEMDVDDDDIDDGEEDDDDDDYVLSGENKKKIYKCENCKIEYKRFKSYKKHKRGNKCKYREHTPEKPIYINRGPQTEFHCGLCDMQSTNQNEIKLHLDKHSKNDDLSCKLCEFMGKDFADMECHRYNHQPKNIPKMYTCHVCDKRCMVSLSLQFHYRTVHLKKAKGGVCSVCNKEYGSYKIWRNHERWHKAAKFTCDICGVKFLFRNSIISHLKDHENIKLFICDVCGKEFKRRSNLKGHQRSVHDQKQVTCKHCKKVFKNQWNLELHMRSVAQNKQFQCEICSKCFPTTHKLKKHMIWHFDERPFVCELCNTSYKTKPQLRIHMRKHTGFMPYKCSYCPKQFPIKRRLRIHLSVHSGVRAHKCPYCVRSFHNKKDLVVHCDKKHHVSDFKIGVPKKELEEMKDTINNEEADTDIVN